MESASESEFLTADYQDGKLLVGSRHGLVQLYKFGASIECESTHKFDNEVSSVAMSQDATFAFVTLFDAPLYSLVVMSTNGMIKVEQRSLLAVMAYEAYSDILENASLALEFKEEQEMEEGLSIADI